MEDGDTFFKGRYFFKVGAFYVYSGLEAVLFQRGGAFSRVSAFLRKYCIPLLMFSSIC